MPRNFKKRKNFKNNFTNSVLSIRPYQLLCIVCNIGENSIPEDKKLKNVLKEIRKFPDRPIILQCNAGGVYSYQDPGVKEDTPEGSDYNRKRDMDILQHLDLAPGSILPARTLFLSLLKNIPTVSGICGYDIITSDAWKGCPKAKSGNYEKGIKRGIDAIIPPRTKGEMLKSKEKTLKEIYKAKQFFIRPHHLLCAVCQYGSGIRPPYEPDNLPEFLERVSNEQELLITLIRGPEPIICAPCPYWVGKLKACVGGAVGSGGLYDEIKDLNVLQKSGLTYGTTMKAKQMYKLIFEKIPNTKGICCLNNTGKTKYSIWRDGCGTSFPDGNENYIRGRKILMKKFI